MDWLRIHVSNLCNFKCPNCHVFELGDNNLPHQVMSQEVFNQAVDQFLEIMSSQGHKSTMISLYGGETLANKAVIKEGIERYGKKSNGIGLNWVVNTNGSLLKEEDVLFFKKHDVEIHISVDGPEKIHDLSRPTHTGKGTFSMVRTGLELIQKHAALAQINSYMMPSNFLHLNEIVDVASSYGIKKIYLDQFYNLEMISHHSGIERYRQVYFYALHKGIQVNGPWGRVIEKHQNFIKRRAELENHLAIDVNVDGTFYFPLLIETKKERRNVKELASFFMEKKWNNVVEDARLYYDEKCAGCSIKDHCYGSAIEQVHYHVGADADARGSCHFFQDWCNFLLRPVFYKQYEKMDVFSLIDLEEVGPMAQKIAEEIGRLEAHLWPLTAKVMLNISEYREEFKLACRQYNLPDWVRAITVGDKYFFHLGAELTPALTHELAHLFLAQKKLNLPFWFVEGVCEWIQDAMFDDELLKKALVENNLLEKIADFFQRPSNKNFLDWDANVPSKNPYYVQAKAFVCYLEKCWGREKLLQVLLETSCDGLVESFQRQGEKLEEHWQRFTRMNLDGCESLGNC